MDRLEMFARLDRIELERYSGVFEELSSTEQRLLNYALNSKVNISLAAKPEQYDNWLYEAARRVEGEHISLLDVRDKLRQHLLNSSPMLPIFDMLAALPSGIYVGNPEDVLNFRRNQEDSIIYPLIGLGDKIANVTLLGSKELPAGL